MKFPRPRKGIPTAVRSSAHRLIDGWVDHVESAPTSAHSAVIGLGVWRKPVIFALVSTFFTPPCPLPKLKRKGFGP